MFQWPKRGDGSDADTAPFRDIGDLKGQVAVISGSTSGIGLALARSVAARGGDVVLNGLGDPSEIERTRSELETSCGVRVRYHAADMRKGEEVADMVAYAKHDLGRLDILVNNAGIGHTPQPMEALAEAEFDRIFAVNAKAIYLLACEVVPVMKAAGGGAILNIASTGGVSPRPNLTWYNASKGWVITATRAMAVELAASQIRVNALNPVAGETPLLKTFMGEDTPEIRAKFLSSIPLGRFSTPADMGAAAAFLCSDDASMITGVALEVDGGRCI